MLKDLIRAFLDGAIAGILNTFFGGYVTSYIPLPALLSNAIVLGILVLIVDYILNRFARL